MSLRPQKLFFFSKCLEAVFRTENVSGFFAVFFPSKNNNFYVISQYVSEFLSEVTEFSGSSFPKKAKKALGLFGKHNLLLCMCFYSSLLNVGPGRKA